MVMMTDSMERVTWAALLVPINFVCYSFQIILEPIIVSFYRFCDFSRKLKSRRLSLGIKAYY